MRLKRVCFARPPKFRIRLVMMIVGVTLMGLGLSLLIRLNLGTDPCSSMTNGLIRYLPVSFGTAQLLCHLVTFSFVIRLDRSMLGLGTIGNMVCLGYITDFWGWVWNGALPEDFFRQTGVRYGLLIPVLVVFILGASAYMTAGLGVSPYDALPFIVSARLKKPSFKVIRMIWDTCFMTAGFLLGAKVGVVTVALAFFLGPVIAWMGKVLDRLIREQ